MGLRALRIRAGPLFRTLACRISPGQGPEVRCLFASSHLQSPRMSAASYFHNLSDTRFSERRPSCEPRITKANLGTVGYFARAFGTEAEVAVGGQVISCHTLEAWNEQLQKGNDSKKLLVVDFTASWCAPCRFIAPFFVELAEKFPSVTFLKVDVDELKSVAADLDIEAMPTFVFMKEGKILSRVVGAKTEDLQLTLEKHQSTA
ncbi:thioredoxin H1-like [Malania oleifera]|uniref:thioredoxin H1-like n=1 Tax=Malania oleifera TaxID=397392 RepID=UPI0025ADD451|nr:thioredoxin H1-like [Malania oleifera]